MLPERHYFLLEILPHSTKEEEKISHVSNLTAVLEPNGKRIPRVKKDKHLQELEYNLI